MNIVYKLTAISFLLFLADCAINSACPFVKTWSDRDQDRMADQLVRVPAESPLMKAIEDYARMRSEAQACHDG